METEMAEERPRQPTDPGIWPTELWMIWSEGREGEPESRRDWVRREGSVVVATSEAEAEGICEQASGRLGLVCYPIQVK